MTWAYDAEDQAEALYPPRSYGRFAELVEDVERIVCSDWWSARFPNAPVEITVQQRSSSARYSAAARHYDAGQVAFLRQHWDLGTVCHELAHLTVPDDDHGLRWQTAYVALTREYRGFHAAAALASAFGLKMPDRTDAELR